MIYPDKFGGIPSTGSRDIVGTNLSRWRRHQRDLHWNQYVSPWPLVGDIKKVRGDIILENVQVMLPEAETFFFNEDNSMADLFSTFRPPLSPLLLPQEITKKIWPPPP